MNRTELENKVAVLQDLKIRLHELTQEAMFNFSLDSTSAFEIADILHKCKEQLHDTYITATTDLMRRPTQDLQTTTND